MSELKLLEERSGGLVTWTLNRPDRLNALDLDTILQLDAAIARARADDTVRAVLITGSGRGFCSGADVKNWASGADEAQSSEKPPEDDGWVPAAHRVVTALYRLAKPVIAAVNGVAVGAGLDLASAADFRIASSTARFGSVYIKLGIPPDAGASYFLPRIVGVTHAKELIYTGRIIDASEAERIGLVSKVVEPDDLLAGARAFAEPLTNGPTQAIGAAKHNIQAHWTAEIEGALVNEERAGRVAVNTDDHREGLAAVSSKRTPQFVGH